MEKLLIEYKLWAVWILRHSKHVNDLINSIIYNIYLLKEMCSFGLVEALATLPLESVPEL